VGNQIVDSKGRPFLMRGTQLPAFHPLTAAENNRADIDYGAHSATSLSALRLRFNMNTVRLPVDVSESSQPGYFPALARVIQRANQMDLLVILAAYEPGASLPSAKTDRFWSHAAAYFKSYPNVVFDVFADPQPAPEQGDAHSATGWQQWRRSFDRVVRAVRSVGATQPIVVTGWNDGRMFEGAEVLSSVTPLACDANVIYAASARYGTARNDRVRQARFGFLAERVPVLVSGLDLNLNDPVQCAALPADPAAVAEQVRDNLNYFDAHQISWTISALEPGRLVKDLSFHDATTLENGWTCAQPNPSSTGLGRIIQGHLRSVDDRGLFVVSGAGGLDVARGGFALAYGAIMAERDSRAPAHEAPQSLGKISVRITDSLGVTRRAGVMWASAGWGQVNFVIPEESALGPAKMAIVRDDGSTTSTKITIAETAPGFVTGHSCRGPAIGQATQTFAGGRTVNTPISYCEGIECHTIPIPIAAGVSTRVRLQGSGFRHARGASDFEITIAGERVPVVSFGPAGSPGEDHVTIELPQHLRSLGEADLVCRIRGRISNAVRIHLGDDHPVS
jgi:uncharacterized protein (TIGR03437 family)